MNDLTVITKNELAVDDLELSRLDILFGCNYAPELYIKIFDHWIEGECTRIDETKLLE